MEEAITCGDLVSASLPRWLSYGVSTTDLYFLLCFGLVAYLFIFWVLDFLLFIMIVYYDLVYLRYCMFFELISYSGYNLLGWPRRQPIRCWNWPSDWLLRRPGSRKKEERETKEDRREGGAPGGGGGGARQRPRRRSTAAKEALGRGARQRSSEADEEGARQRSSEADEEGARTARSGPCFSKGFNCFVF